MVSYMTQLSEENFQEHIANDLSIVYITAKWCVPCKTLGPIVDELSTELANSSVMFGKMDADECRDVINTIGVRNVPTILVYKNGEIIDKSVGLVTKKSLFDLIDQYL